jgi:hypothetical protein
MLLQGPRGYEFRFENSTKQIYWRIRWLDNAFLPYSIKAGTHKQEKLTEPDKVLLH